MKKSWLVALAGGGLLVAFALGGYAYKSSKAAEVAKLTQAGPDKPATDAGAPGAADAGKPGPPQLSPVLVRPHSMSAGPADAGVVLVEFFDPGCETCRVFAGFVKALVAANPGKVRLVLRYAPFHQGADMAVAMLEAARKQGKYWEALQVMYDAQQQWASHHHPQPERLWDLLPAAGVDVARIRQDIQSPEIIGIVRQDMEDTRTLGVRRTPAFFVNGKPLMDFGQAQLRDLIESELGERYPR